MRFDETRGKVYSFTAGAGVSSDRDLGPGWRHVVAVRQGRELRLYTNGKMVATSVPAQETIDVSNGAPLQIGFGAQAHFRGKVREIQVFNKALSDDEVNALYQIVDP
jgi:hypothetical protein